MANLCAIHSKQAVSNDGICSRCKSCGHKSWFKREGEQFYQCDSCYKTSKSPTGEKWTITKEGKWREDK